MKYNDSEYKKKLEVIQAIPSNKIDKDNLQQYSDATMAEFNQKHLRDLREQVMGYDEQELEAVAEAVTERGWTFTYNALGNYLDRLYRQKEATKIINHE